MRCWLAVSVVTASVEQPFDPLHPQQVGRDHRLLVLSLSTLARFTPTAQGHSAPSARPLVTLTMALSPGQSDHSVSQKGQPPLPPRSARPVVPHLRAIRP
jgi:hypothetical protein